MKFLFVFIFCLILSLFVQAQKLYNTSSGQVKIGWKKNTDKKVSVNNLVESRWLENNGQFFLSAYLKDFVHETIQERNAVETLIAENGKYPKLIIKGFIQDIQSIDLSNSGANTFQIEGNLWLHGIAQNITILGTLTVLSSGKILIQAENKLKWKDFNISDKAFLNSNGPEFILDLYAIFE